jgi:glyoxalase family protein
MSAPIRGLHHVTATVDDAQRDLDFAVGALGQRLVKRTVNFDNPGVYHFYYGDEVGHPGTIWTTFPYRGMGVSPGAHGAGQVTVTSFSVPSGSSAAWKTRLTALGIDARETAAPFGAPAIIVTDPSGLILELTEDARDQRGPWTATVDAATAIRGLHRVTLSVADPAPTVAFMHEFLGFALVNEAEGVHRLGIEGDAPGRIVDVVPSSEPRGRNGLGTVHHVAFAIDDADDQLRLRAELLKRGVQVTPVMDRNYFRSIYFREPGGVLFEVATTSPGFTVDEPVTALGRGLKLPPSEEPRRDTIAAGLPAVIVPGAT